MVAIPNIGSILNNLPFRVDPRLEAVRLRFFFVHVFNMTKVCPLPSVHCAVEGAEEVREDRCRWVRSFNVVEPGISDHR